MYKISKEFHFCASHQLRDLTPEHPCSRVHGHNYIVIVALESITVNTAGMILDYREMEPFKNWIDTEFDHRHLNDIEPFNETNPTAENMAEYFFRYCKDILNWSSVKSITVKETPKTTATYYE